MSVCKSCGAALRWAITEKGKRIPLDAKPTADGSFYFIGPDEVRFKPPTVTAVDVDVFTTHFLTCPFAGQHRKKAANRD